MARASAIEAIDAKCSRHTEMLPQAPRSVRADGLRPWAQTVARHCCRTGWACVSRARDCPRVPVRLSCWRNTWRHIHVGRPGTWRTQRDASGWRQSTTLNAGGFKGQPFVTFGATKWLSASFSIATPCELFCAFKTTTPASNQYVSDFGTNSLILNINTNNVNLYSGGTAFGTGPVSANTIHYANGQYNGASSVVSLDAGSDVTGSPGTGGETGTFTVGNVGSHNTGLLGDLYEVFGFASILSAGDRASVKAYLASWYS